MSPGSQEFSGTSDDLGGDERRCGDHGGSSSINDQQAAKRRRVDGHSGTSSTSHGIDLLVDKCCDPVASAEDRSNSKANEIGIRIGWRDVEALKGAYYFSIESVAYATKKRLSQVSGISLEKADLLLAKAQSLMATKTSFTSASKLLQSDQLRLVISTGSKAIDSLLDGGIEAETITEVSGLAGSGKTQLCHTMAVICQLPIELGGGGENTSCLYMDTSNSFRAERIVQIAKRFPQLPDSKQILARIVIGKCFNTQHQANVLKMASKLLAEKKFSLIIVDSVAHLFRSEYIGRAELSERQQLLGLFLRKLTELIRIYRIPCLITNEMVDHVESCASTSTGSRVSSVAIGGHVLAHSAKTRILLKRECGYKQARICHLYSSPSLPTGEVKFAIDREGVKDIQSSSSSSTSASASPGAPQVAEDEVENGDDTSLTVVGVDKFVDSNNNPEVDVNNQGHVSREHGDEHVDDVGEVVDDDDDTCGRKEVENNFDNFADDSFLIE